MIKHVEIQHYDVKNADTFDQNFFCQKLIFFVKNYFYNRLPEIFG